MRRNSFLWLTSCICVALLVTTAIWLLSGNVGSERPLSTAKTPHWKPSQAASVVQNNAPASVPVSQRSAPSEVSGKPTLAALIGLTRSEFEGATDLRVFAQSARGRPEVGGYFYAIKAAEICSRGTVVLDNAAKVNLGNEIAAKGTVAARKIELTNQAQALCAGFAEGEASAFVSQMQEIAKNNKDPILLARGRTDAAVRTGDTESVRKAASELLRLGDPIAVADGLMLLRLMNFRPTSENSRSLWFGGEDFGVEATGELSLAIELARCTPGSPCKSQDALSISCASVVGCETDLIEFQRGLYLQSGGSEPRFGHILGLSGRIRSAIQSGAVDAFIRPSKP
jgi:hypothetical protein